MPYKDIPEEVLEINQNESVSDCRRLEEDKIKDASKHLMPVVFVRPNLACVAQVTVTQCQ